MRTKNLYSDGDELSVVYCSYELIDWADRNPFIMNVLIGKSRVGHPRTMYNLKNGSPSVNHLKVGSFLRIPGMHWTNVFWILESSLYLYTVEAG